MIQIKRIYLSIGWLFSLAILSQNSTAANQTAKKSRSSSQCESRVSTGGFDWSDLSQPVPPSISIADFKRQHPKVEVYPDSDEDLAAIFMRSQNGDAFINIGQRVFYLSKNPEKISEVIPNSGDFVWIRETRIQEFPDHYAFELSRLPYIGALVGEYNGRFGWDDGPNCWNFCQLYHGWVLSSQNTDILDHVHWLDKSPFFEMLGEYQEGLKLLPGDVIDIRLYRDGKRIPDGHAAINLNGALLIHKAGLKYAKPYEIRRLSQEFDFYRRVERPGETLEGRFFIFRAKSFSQIWSENKSNFSKELIQWSEKVSVLEKLDRQFTLPDRMNPSDLPDDHYQKVRSLKREIILGLGKEAPKVKELYAQSLSTGDRRLGIQHYFWKRLYLRFHIQSQIDTEPKAPKNQPRS